MKGILQFCVQDIDGFSSGVSAGLKDLQVEVVDQKMLLACEPDQPKEHGIFQRMFNLGLSNGKSERIVSVTRR